MARLGMTADASPDAWRFCATAEEAVMEAEFVQENAPERLATKRELYARLDPVMPADTVLASSTSGLIMSEMQAGLRSRARFVVGHPFNPPHLIPLVEVVGGRETSPEVVAWCSGSFVRNHRPEKSFGSRTNTARFSPIAAIREVDGRDARIKNLRYAIE
jgi:3-hydroxyacyl-CoA dehydrogenase